MFLVAVVRGGSTCDCRVPDGNKPKMEMRKQKTEQHRHKPYTHGHTMNLLQTKQSGISGNAPPPTYAMYHHGGLGQFGQPVQCMCTVHFLPLLSVIRRVVRTFSPRSRVSWQSDGSFPSLLLAACFRFCNASSPILHIYKAYVCRRRANRPTPARRTDPGQHSARPGKPLPIWVE